MRMRWAIATLSAALLASVFIQAPKVHAVALKVAPLEYRTTLSKGQSKRGFIDVSNPNGATVRIRTSVQAFKQVDDQGSLSFYDNESLTAGVKLDLDEFDLGPREAVRMYFELDGTKLPPGDVFGAIFFTTEPIKPTAGVGQGVRLGTLLSITNGTAGARSASVTKLSVPWLQFDNDVEGSYTIKNTGDPATQTGFYPDVRVSAKPFGQVENQKSSLVFAGRARENDFSRKVPPFGLYKISASYNGKGLSKWVFVLTPISMLFIALLILILVIFLGGLKRYKKLRKR